MRAAWFVARAQLRRRWGERAVVLTLIVGITGAVVLASLAGARRTSSAIATVPRRDGCGGSHGLRPERRSRRDRPAPARSRRVRPSASLRQLMSRGRTGSSRVASGRRSTTTSASHVDRSPLLDGRRPRPGPCARGGRPGGIGARHAVCRSVTASPCTATRLSRVEEVLVTVCGRVECTPRGPKSPCGSSGSRAVRPISRSRA